MKQIILLTGARGSGKTTAIANYVSPLDYDKLCIVDTEDSWSDTLKNLAKLDVTPGAYLRAYERFKPDTDLLDSIAKGKLPWVSKEQKAALIEYYEWFTETLSKTLEYNPKVGGRFRYLAIDTIEPLEAAMTAWAETNKKESGWSGQRAYGRLETEAVRPLYENLLEAIARRGVETILLSSHLKRVWENDKPILNKVQPGGRLVVLSRLSSMMFWLTQADNADGAPAAIVLKARLGQTKIVNGQFVTRRVLPQRIPHFTWQDVEQYRQEPADLKQPKLGEVMSSDEREMISEMLNDAQMRLMVLDAEKELQETVTVIAPTAEKVLSLPERIKAERERHNGNQS